MMKGHFGLFCVGLLGIITRTYGGACSNGELVGNSNPQSDQQNLDSENGVSVLHVESDFKVPCDCGEIYQWGHYANAEGDVHFQVWRDTGSTYKLVGENMITFTSANQGNHVSQIPTGQTIYAVKDDYLAIYQPGNAVITRGNGNGNDYKKTTSVNGATSYDWNSESIDGSKDYAFNARVNPVPTNSPTISNLDGSVSVSDSASVGTSVFTVVVADVDGDIDSTEMTTVSTYFSFDTLTLEVSVLSTAPANTYPLDFKVTDRCANSATATLSVTVTDPCAGNVSPTFSDATPTASISTTAAVGTTVSTLTVSDADGDTITKVMTLPSTYFSFDTSLLEVKVLSSVPAATYTLNFEVNDDCSNTATATLSVTVTDPCAGNVSPTFSDATPTASISTTAVVGTTVSTLTVSDADGGTLTTVMTPSSAYFTFDASPLEVKVLSSVPAATYTLNFEVNDDCSNTATATLSVTVTDPCAGNVSPTFSDATPTASISTTAVVGTTVSTLTVSDADGGTLTTVMTPSSSYFSFDTSLLEVKVLSSVPAATYTLNFEVNDDCSNTATATLSVTVTDPCAGNVSPTFSDATPTASISTTAVVGTTVSTLTVSDADGGTLTTVMTPSSAYFTFDASPLEVKVLSSVPAATYTLNFEVNDDCSNTATATLSVTVTDPCAGNVSPTFSDATPTASISTTAVVGTTVSTLTVSDADGGTLTTVMTPSSSYFSFDTSLLEVKVLSSVPAATYTLNFEVNDDCSNTATATLSVTVTDPCAGNVSPTFSDATPTASISTTAVVGTTVSTLTVSDADGGTLTTVMTPSSAYFTFDASPLEVKVLSSVPAATYTLNFEVNDDCSNTATATLSVTVTDPCAGNVSPTFSDATPTASISTTAVVGTTVSTLTVSDADGGTLTTVMTPSSSYFSFDTSLLEVKVLSSVPAATYTLNFEVNDDCSNTATATLSVTVTDPCAGNVSPTFSDATPTASISSTAAVGTTVSTLTVSDADGGTLTTVMTSSPAYFTFDVSPLDVKVSSTVPAGSYSLAFQTTDDCSNTATCTLSVTVLSLSEVTPTFAILTASASLPEDYSIGTTVVRLTVSDPDGGTTTTTMTSPSAYFELDPATLDVKVLSTLASGTYVLEFQVVDNDGNIGTSQLNITVDNSKPLIGSLPSYAYVKETTSAENLLHTLVTSDASPSDSVTCFLGASDPSSSDFTVKVISGTSYGIYSLTGHSFNYGTTNRYKLTINCTDTKDDVTEAFYVYILPNSPPTFTNLPSVTSMAISSSSGASVFNVTGSDTEGDTLTYTMACSGCPFQIANGGQISTSQVLSGTTVGYDLQVYVTDTITSVGPHVLTVKISNINADPVIQNLPLSINISVLENQSVGTTVFQVVAADVDTSQTLAYSLSATPSSGQTVFTVDSNGLITTSLLIDYEAMTDTYFNIMVTVSDGQASDSQYLYVIIQDVNEAPGFSSPSYYLTANEEQVRGTSLGTPSYGTTDPESDSILYSIDCYQFMIDSSTGEITFYEAYDLDRTGSSSPISCIVSAGDGELTGTASLIVTINDINDNNPIFDDEIYTFTSSVSAETGDVVGTLTATDADYSTLYGAVTYTINQTLLDTTYFGISGTGSLFAVRDLVALGNGTVHYITVTATDTDENSDTSLVTIIIPDYSTSANDVTDSEDRYLTFIEDTKNVAWLTSFCLASFGSICLIGYLINKHGLLKFWMDGFKETFKTKGDKAPKTTNVSDTRQQQNGKRTPNSTGRRSTRGNHTQSTNSGMNRQKIRDIRKFINAQTTHF